MDQTQPIFGLDISLDECDWIAFERFPPKLVEEERYLFARKWFDYRGMHYVHATYLFADAYRTAYRESFARNIDRARSEFVKGMKGEDIFDPARKRGGDMSGFIRARQHADMLGMPYIEYARAAFHWKMRRSRDHLPRPCHLYGYELLTAIQETWQERQAGMPFVATGAIFKNEAYRDLPVQNAHHEWLLQQSMLRPNGDRYLARVLYDDDVLLESKVAARFGEERLERIRALN